MKLLLSFLATLAAALAASCAEAADECSGGKNQIELTQCYDRLYRRADDELNAVYRHLAGNLAADARTTEYGALLEAAERDWIAFRDKECAFETAVTQGGTIHAMEVAICLTRLTRAHSQELKRQLACSEGDLSCVR